MHFCTKIGLLSQCVLCKYIQCGTQNAFFKTHFSYFNVHSRFLSLTSQSPQYWMTSNRITQITTGMVYFTFVYGIGATICNALLEWNIFPTYTVCLVEAVVEKELDNSIVLAFFVMPSLLMAYTTPIIDLVTFRLMKFWSNQSRQIPKGTLPNWKFLGHFNFVSFYERFWKAFGGNWEQSEKKEAKPPELHNSIMDFWDFSAANGWFL